MKYDRLVLGSIMITALIFASCGKVKTPYVYPTVKQHNQDVTNTKSESDAVNTDVNNAMVNITGFGKNSSVEAVSICGATVDSSHNTGAQPYIILTFDGTTICPNPNRTRSGTIKVQLVSGTSWSNAGAQLLLTFTNYKVTYTGLNNAFLNFNGTKLLTDVNGIDWLTYYITGAATASLRERTYNMTVGFENGQTSTWNSARLSTWTVTNYSNFSTTVKGDTSIGGVTTDSWGLTRYGTHFATQMIQPWQSGTSCGWWNPTSGNYTSVTDSFTVSALLGVNSSGNQVSSGCAYGFKLNWTLAPSNITGEATIPYW